MRIRSVLTVVSLLIMMSTTIYAEDEDCGSLHVYMLNATPYSCNIENTDYVYFHDHIVDKKAYGVVTNGTYELLSPGFVSQHNVAPYEGAGLSISLSCKAGVFQYDIKPSQTQCYALASDHPRLNVGPPNGTPISSNDGSTPLVIDNTNRETKGGDVERHISSKVAYVLMEKGVTAWDAILSGVNSDKRGKLSATDNYVLYAPIRGQNGSVQLQYEDKSATKPTFQALPNLSATTVHAIKAFEPSQQEARVYAVTDQGVEWLKFTDSSANWQALRLPKLPHDLKVNVNSILLPYAESGNYNDIYVAAHQGMWHSVDNGKSWIQVLNYPTKSLAMYPKHPVAGGVYQLFMGTPRLGSAMGAELWVAKSSALQEATLLWSPTDGNISNLAVVEAGEASPTVFLTLEKPLDNHQTQTSLYRFDLADNSSTKQLSFAPQADTADNSSLIVTHWSGDSNTIALFVGINGNSQSGVDKDNWGPGFYELRYNVLKGKQPYLAYLNAYGLSGATDIGFNGNNNTVTPTAFKSDLTISDIALSREAIYTSNSKAGVWYKSDNRIAG